MAVFGPNSLADLVAIDAGQHDVQQDQVETARQRFVEAVRAFCGAVHLVTVEDEHVDQAFPDRCLVFYDQNANRPRHSVPRLAPKPR